MLIKKEPGALLIRFFLYGIYFAPRIALSVLS